MLMALKKQWVLFCYTLSFFSRCPIVKSITFKEYPFHLGNAYFPLLGVLIALLSFIAYYFAHSLFNDAISIIFMLLAGVLLTGAFHEDGFADCCDAFGGGYNKQQRLAIMKDSQIGSYAVVGLIVLFSLKINVLISLAEKGELAFLLALISAASLSRLSTLYIMQFSDYARAGSVSKSSSSSQRLPLRYFITATLFTLLTLSGFSISWMLTVIALVSISTLLCYLYFNNKIAGYSGDCLGFLQQLNELLILLALLALYQ